MNWKDTVKNVIVYIESHIDDVININEIAKKLFISPFYLQKGFKLMTGYTISDYINYRRLYLAAIDIMSSKEKIINIAFKYGYEYPESFTRAFKKFHGFNPSKTRKESENIRKFLPFEIDILVKRRTNMDYIIEKKEKFTVIGFIKEFDMRASYKEIPEFWDECFAKHMKNIIENSFKPQNDIENAILENIIGEFGVCIDDLNQPYKFRYLIGGTYKGGKVPENMVLYEIPSLEWAIFKIKGPMPNALQEVNTKIFQDWLPNSEYNIATGIDIEWYSDGDTSSEDYESAIWIPIVKK